MVIVHVAIVSSNHKNVQNCYLKPNSYNTKNRSSQLITGPKISSLSNILFLSADLYDNWIDSHIDLSVSLTVYKIESSLNWI